MAFTSPFFLFCFFPLLFIVLRMVSIVEPSKMAFVLLLFSAVFYIVNDSLAFYFIAITICMNYLFAQQLGAAVESSYEQEEEYEKERLKKRILVFALVCNIAPLLWFKYANFFVESICYLLSTTVDFRVETVPPGISFYTFIQIAYLVSIYRGSVVKQNLSRHALFSLFFPYILSGPLVRYEDMGMQFDRYAGPKRSMTPLGISLFSVGLFKKLVIADGLAPVANAVFLAAQKGLPLTCGEAWLGTLSYSFQLYFDFSGYTDMAIGIGLMLGFQLPENFISPYKATGIVDFWRRWHITLGLWLRDFLYIPLGGNRRGKLIQYRNLFLTMLIGGAWHGAGLTFIIWGALHGLMLCINHFFRSQIKGRACEKILALLPFRILSIGLTFFCLTLCWVFFRADSLPSAWTLLSALFTAPISMSGVDQTLQGFLPNHYIQYWYQPALLAFAALITWFAPASHEIFTRRSETIPALFRFKLSKFWAVFLSFLAFVSLLCLSDQPTFLYFQF